MCLEGPRQRECLGPIKLASTGQSPWQTRLLCKACQSLVGQSGISVLPLPPSQTAHFALSCGTGRLRPVSLWTLPWGDLQGRPGHTGGSEEREDFAACTTGFASASTFGCCTFLGQPPTVYLLISEIGVWTRDNAHKVSDMWWEFIRWQLFPAIADIASCVRPRGLSFFFLESWARICPRITSSTFRLGI